MKRLLLIALVLLMAVPVVDARRRKPRAGEVEDKVYRDATYDFSLRIEDNWNFSRGYEEDAFRLILTQKNWETPPYYLDNPDYTKVPRISVYADTTSMGVFAFIDSLVSPKYESEQKDEILREFEIFQRDPDWEPIVPIGRKVLEIDGQRAVLWTGKVQYKQDVALSASGAGSKRIRENYFGSILGVKKGNTIVALHVMGEWVYYDRIQAEFLKMAQSLDFTTDEEEKDETKEG